MTRNEPQLQSKRRLFDTFRPPWTRRKTERRPYDTMRPPGAGAAESSDLPSPETYAPRTTHNDER